jgi:hypothetical protein
MVANNDLERLRAEVRARHAAATRKISRLRREKGVELSGSLFDLRRDINKIKRYNKAQLNKYLMELTTFNHRGTQFVAGKQGKPIPAKDWQYAKSLEAQINSIANQHNASVANVHDPLTNLPIGKRDATMRPDRVRAAGEAAMRPFEVREREARHVNGAEGVQALIKSMEKKLKPTYFKASLTESRRQANQMLKVMGAKHLQKSIRKLSDYQFDVLWNYLKLSDALSAKYEIRRKSNVSEERWYAKAYEDKAEDVEELINHAHANIPRENTNAGPIPIIGKRKRK